MYMCHVNTYVWDHIDKLVVLPGNYNILRIHLLYITYIIICTYLYAYKHDYTLTTNNVINVRNILTFIFFP